MPDAIIELKLTPNRADCLGMEGLATEVAALFGIVSDVPVPALAPTEGTRSVVATLNAGASCPRFVTRVIEGIEFAAATPAWMRTRLTRGGIRPVNALVDIGNYVMLETGQPVHVFDRARVAAGLEVRWSRAGERLQLLDGSEVEFSAETLLVADENGPLGVAGIMGGMSSRVSEATCDVLLEAAHFTPGAIAGRARRYGLQSEAAHRFERGVDPALPRRALERLSELLLSICGGRAGPVAEAVLPDALPTVQRVVLRAARIERVLGISPARDEVRRILESLGMQVAAVAEGWEVVPSSRRFDIAIEEDLIEEVARVVGYDAIPARVPQGAISAPSLHEGRLDSEALAGALRQRGYTEAVNFSFVDAVMLERWNLAEGAVRLANPLSSDLGVMRTALLPGLVQALARNVARQQSRVRLFEIGRVFRSTGTSAAPVEHQRVAGCVAGSVNPEQWGIRSRPVDFHDIKGDVEQVLALAGTHGRTLQVVAEPAHWLHPGRGATLELDGHVIGWFGALSPRVQRALDIDTEVHVFEFDLDPLLRRSIPRARELSKFPSVRRDLSLMLSEGTPFAEIEACVRAAAGPLLQELVLFDRFVGKDLPAGCKSVAIGLILQEPSRTLAEEDVARTVNSVVAAVERRLGGRLRE